MRSWIDVAVLGKTKSLDGRFVVRATAGLPFLLKEGDEVAFVPPQTDLPRRAVVESIADNDGRSACVVFAGIDGQAARGLVGCHCLIRRDRLDEGVFEEEPSLWDGWMLVDGQEGEIGEIVGLADNPGQALLEVRRSDGSTLLVPVVDEIIRDVDVDSGTVHANLPQGLLDL